jgi:hypothetical protein
LNNKDVLRIFSKVQSELVLDPWIGLGALLAGVEVTLLPQLSAEQLAHPAQIHRDHNI